MTDLHDPQTALTDEVPTQADNGRRAALRRLALGGVGAAAGAVAFSQTANAGDEAGGPTGGNATELGLTNTSVAPTIINNTPAAAVTQGPSAFSAGGYVPAANAPFPAGVGGYGDLTIPNGVHGSTLDPDGFGVVAANLAAALADGATEAPPAGLAVASTGGPQIKFVANSVSGPTTGTHVAGEMYVDADGTLWFTVPVPAVPPATDDGVRFVKLAGAPTAGSFHILPTAQRVYDSRELTTPTKATVGDSIDLDLTKNLDGDDSGVPAGAIAAQINVTLDATELSGFGRVVAKGVLFADENSSNINWYQTGQILANQATTALSDDGGISVQFAGAGGSTHLIVDVQGYYA